MILQTKINDLAIYSFGEQNANFLKSKIQVSYPKLISNCENYRGRSDDSK